MSGGELEYFHWSAFGYMSEVIKADSPVFSRIVHDLGDVLLKYDYWISGDTNEEGSLRCGENFVTSGA